MPERSPVPPIPLRPLGTAEVVLFEVERLRDLAEDAGLSTLAYLLDVARMEARRAAEQAVRDAAERDADPRNLWRPPGV